MASNKELETIRCNGSICWGPNHALTVEEIEVEAPQAMEVRVRLLFASLCHTDITLWKNAGLYPRVLGHEGVGVIESVGDGVEGFNEGDIVIPSYVGECGECKNCKSGKTHHCLTHPFVETGLMPDMTSRISVKGQKVYHMFSCSTFMEYTVVSTNYIVKVDPRVTLTHASLISCGFSTGFGGVWKEAKVEPGSTVAVFGLGAVGIGAIVGAKLHGASKIIGVDLNERKKEKAEHFGMTDFINPTEIGDKSTSEVIREITGGSGVDYSFECTGSQPVINDAFEATVLGAGVTIVLGVYKEKFVSVNRSALMDGRILKGSTLGGIKPRSDFPPIVAKCIQKEIVLDEMVTYQVDLDDINHGVELMNEPDCFKVVVKVSKD